MTSVTRKFVMALSGIVLLAFVGAHLAGNLLVYFWRDALNAYARALHASPFLVWPVRVILAGCVLNHVVIGLRLFFKNRTNNGYIRRRYLVASFASRSMSPTGVVILIFIIYHLAHLTLKVTDSRFANLESHDVYGMLMLSFSELAVASFYVISMIFLGLHLNHGIASMMQTLGVKSHKYQSVIIVVSKGLAWLIMLGNISIPLSIYLGVLR